LTDAVLNRLRRESRNARKNRYSAYAITLSTKSRPDDEILCGFSRSIAKTSMQNVPSALHETMLLRYRRAQQRHLRYCVAMKQAVRSCNLLLSLWLHCVVFTNRSSAATIAQINFIPATARRQFRLIRGMEPRDPDFEHWPAKSAVGRDAPVMPGWGITIWRGLRGQCPRCGVTRIFVFYLKVSPKCAFCDALLGDMPADDAPPYIAMVVVLQILAVFVVIFFKGHYQPAIWVGALWLILLAVICMFALRLAKGAVIGILLKLGLRREALNG
jgi:uncharacterized protein (DUF983 family)